MSNDNISIDGSIDAGWTSYYNSDMSETVDVHDSEDGGSVDNQFIPKEADLEELNDSQREIIAAAGANVNLSSSQLADKLDVTPAHVRNVLQENVPNWYDNMFKESGSSSKYGRGPDYDYEEIYALVEDNGHMSAQEVADSVGCSQKTARKALNEGVEDGRLRTVKGYGSYHGRTSVYFPAESDTDAAESESVEDECETTDSANLSVTEPETVEMELEEEEPTAGGGTFTDGDKEALNGLFGDSVATGELEAAIDAMKAIAVHQETVDALEVIEDYL